VSTEGTRACHHKHAHQQVNQKGSIFLSIFVCGLTDSRIELGFYRNFIILLDFCVFFDKVKFILSCSVADSGSGIRCLFEPRIRDPE
jgi:hypothetical protein